MSDKFVILTPDAKIAEIKRLYYATTRRTIQQDLARAVQLLKSMDREEERERAAVYMDGLSQMRSDWKRQERAKSASGSRSRPGRVRRP
jgi:hypothetical protein